ncbi:MAG TPA: hypothetical protein VF737_05450 [Gemmatimonadaceae bacterium]
MTPIPLFGHTAVRRRLESAVERGTLPASLLLHGPAGIGKQRLALWLGQRLLCDGPPPRPCGKCQQCRYAEAGTHPDLRWIFPRPRLKDSNPTAADVFADHGEAVAERVAAHGLYAAPPGNEGIYIATIRAIVQSAAMAPALAARKVFVIGDAERMVSQDGADQAANAFLKLLEEPPADTNVVLTSSEPGALLPTIRSRVIAVRMSRLTDVEVGALLDDERVRDYLREQSVSGDRSELLRTAGGAPGVLLAQSTLGNAMARARRMLEAASGDRVTRLHTAFVQGSARARGEFADALQALTVLLHERTRAALASADEEAAVRAARAADAVERAKERAAGNGNPQLVTFTLLGELEAALR